MKEKSSYKINILSNDAAVQENSKFLYEKIKMNDFEKMKEICIWIDKITQDKDLNKISKITKELVPYENYFNQNLMNKGEYQWNIEEFKFYFYYFKFKLFLLHACSFDNRKVDYYSSALKIYSNIYEDLTNITNISFYEKICAITSLYQRLKGDAENKENKKYIIGKYTLLNMNNINNDNICYKLVKDFINKIIENLEEKSFIFLPLLQANSGFNKYLNSDDEKEVFELSMINIDMFKKHLKLLFPKLIFLIRHPMIESKRSSTDKMTGNIFIYESSIFRNNLSKSVDEIIKSNPEDAAVTISFVILHEFFMHKKIRSNPDFIPGKETPPKFIGPKLDIKNFYYSNDKKNLDPLSVYNKNENENINKITKEGECGKILAYFLENSNFEIIHYLKKYIGFGDLLEKVDLIVDENLDRLHSYVKSKIANGEARPLLKEIISGKNCRDYIFSEGDEDVKGEKEEEEEDEYEDEELSEETKRIIKSQTHCY